jgi:TonB family protein
MAEALLYQPNKRWRIAAAFGTAALIHFAAIALANVHQHKQSTDLPPWEDSFPPIDITTDVPTNDSTPPPEVVDPLPLQNPDDQSIFPDERPTPTLVQRRITKLAAPIVRTKNTAIGSVSLASARISALSAPRPEYPYEARRQKITGSGIVAMAVDPVTGRVTEVVVEASTGSSVLDNAAVAAFGRWRFKPGTISKVKCPITFTMAGTQY